MEISKNGKKYLQRCGRIELVRVIEDFKVKDIRMDEEMCFDLADAVAYYITRVSDDKSVAVGVVNDFVRDLVNNVNRFTEEPVGKRTGWIEFQKQELKKYSQPI